MISLKSYIWSKGSCISRTKVLGKRAGFTVFTVQASVVSHYGQRVSFNAPTTKGEPTRLQDEPPWLQGEPPRLQDDTSLKGEPPQLQSEFSLLHGEPPLHQGVDPPKLQSEPPQLQDEPP